MITIDNLKFSYGAKQALKGVSLRVGKGEVFGFLGPNGSGKTTLFRILATLMVPQSGTVTVDGLDLERDYRKIRSRFGVVFQSPSVDDKLTVFENIRHQGHLYGLWGKTLKIRAAEMAEKLGLENRLGERVDSLSGGLKRRVELAKGLLHRPGLLLLDEPSTGLDPGARLDLWKYLKEINQHEAITILVTTHWMEEAERCSRLAVMSHGEILREGTPEDLKKEVRGDVLVIQTDAPEDLAGRIRQQFHYEGRVMEGAVHVEHGNAASFLTDLVRTFPELIRSITLRKPTLEDVFVRHTGHRFWQEEKAAGAGIKTAEKSAAGRH
ncbi:MAG: ABC transporter ATP-binding protein [Omnitrophica bacterium GWA2_52_8]|nr:MAG: ABC transporter ATP-binding protein [Omnitrophica bacterium GWA2_52_8]